MSYLCAEHGQDLTSLVVDELKAKVPMLYIANFGLLSARTSKERQFRVIVVCPGKGTAHEVAFSGTARR
jgi:hypothetical protein